MRNTAITFFFAAIGLGLFFWWGLFTNEGRRRFDEMDGLYPFFAGCGGLILLIVSVILFALHWRKTRRTQ